MASEIERMNFFSQAPSIICFTKVMQCLFLLSDGRPIRLHHIKRVSPQKVSFHFLKFGRHCFLLSLMVYFKGYGIANFFCPDNRGEALVRC